MKRRAFGQKNIGIFTILILSLSVVSMTSTSSQFVSGLSFSNEVDDLEYSTLYFEQKNDSLQISDNVILVKNGLKIQATVSHDNVQKDSVAISDSVFLAKHVVVATYDSNWDSVAISERITERTKSEKLSIEITSSILSKKRNILKRIPRLDKTPMRIFWNAVSREKVLVI